MTLKKKARCAIDVKARFQSTPFSPADPSSASTRWFVGADFAKCKNHNETYVAKCETQLRDMIETLLNDENLHDFRLFFVSVREN